MLQPKNSPLWKADPDQQHFYYSGRAMCRRHFPDVLLGVYARDEMEDSPRVAAERNAAVSPLRLADRLDRVAAGPTIDHKQPADESADDGDLAPNDASLEAGNRFYREPLESQGTASGAETSADDEASDDTPHGRLLGHLRAEAMQGPGRLRMALGKLTPDETALLTDEGRASLERAAAQVGEG